MKSPKDKFYQINNLLKTLEDINITNLFEAIMNGNYEESLKILKVFAENNSFNSYINDLPFKILFRKIDFLNTNIDSIITKLNQNVKYEDLKVRENDNNYNKKIKIINFKNIIAEEENKVLNLQ